jgi:hypothetical protein
LPGSLLGRGADVGAHGAHQVGAHIRNPVVGGGVPSDLLEDGPVVGRQERGAAPGHDITARELLHAGVIGTGSRRLNRMPPGTEASVQVVPCRMAW